jgi:aldose 1-epimerase
MPGPPQSSATITLRTANAEAEVWPALGGALVSFRARLNGSLIDITQAITPESRAKRNASWLGSFIMAPFANRIAGGHFVENGREIQLPINRPEHQAAIHGFSRGRNFAVAEVSENALTLTDHFTDPGIPYIYDTVFTYVLTGSVLEVGLKVTNRGPCAMPFGLGHHPWFKRTPKTHLRFTAEGWFKRDAHTFPVARMANPAGDVRLTPSALPGFDRHYDHWGRAAEIIWPELDAGLNLTASPSLANLHVFVPEDRSAVCLEPVSHVPDVVNRRRYAAYGDMTALAPGESLTGSMQLAPFALK